MLTWKSNGVCGTNVRGFVGSLKINSTELCMYVEQWDRWRESNRAENNQYSPGGCLMDLKVGNYRERGEGCDVDVAES